MKYQKSSISSIHLLKFAANSNFNFNLGCTIRFRKQFLDPNLENKSKTVENRIQLFDYNGLSLPLPTEIEISESGTCNRSCYFCPRSASDFIDKKEFISNSLNEKLCLELKELNYKGTVRYSGLV